MKPLFMWAGGKTKLLKFYADLFPKAGSVSSYVEPFFGGGALFCHVSKNYDIPNSINDLKTELMDLYGTVKVNPEGFVKELDSYVKKYLKISDKAERKELFYKLRKTYWAMDESVDETKRNALLFFLMKTAFNGIWQTCKDANGRFATPAGLLNHVDSVYDKELISEWSETLKKTKITSGEYSNVHIPENSWVFCDPPYRDSFTNYSSEFGDDRQLALIKWCKDTAKNTKSLVWLSNREANDGFFEKHATGATIHKFPVTYTAGRRKNMGNGEFEAKKAVDLLMIWDGRKKK